MGVSTAACPSPYPGRRRSPCTPLALVARAGTAGFASPAASRSCSVRRRQGASYRARLRATGKHVATSLILSGTSPAAPTNTIAPILVGTPQDGNTLNAGPGAWTGSAPIGYAYEWERCDSSGASCVEVAGEASDRYLLTSADVGATIRVRVRATNSVGAAAAVSPATSAVAARPAFNTAPPSIAGSAREGQRLTAAQGPGPAPHR